MRATRTYSDIDLNFAAHPETKDITRKFDEDAIKQSIENLILTANYERPFHSDIGSHIKHLMFEQITPMLYGIIKQDVSNIISAYEPRVTLIDVITTYKPEMNTINIAIIFTMNGTSLVSQTNIVIDRTR